MKVRHMKTIIYTALFIAIFSINANARAKEGSEVDVGNGGDGVWIGKELVLLDFAEQNYIVRPNVKFKDNLSKKDIVRVAEALKNIIRYGDPADDIVINIVAQKIADIRVKSPELAEAMLTSMEAHFWKFSYEKLEDIKDEGYISFMVVLGYEQLAIRRGPNIRIDEGLWNVLSDVNKAGLIFHEMFYYMLGSSPLARASTAALFFNP